MKRKTPVQRLSALLLLAALPTLNGTIPVLDVMVGDGKDAVEAQHHPDTHGFPHNHLLCIQHQASQWGPGRDVVPALVLGTIAFSAFPNLAAPPLSGQVSLPRARAPPLA
jgi:hypothetical protein